MNFINLCLKIPNLGILLYFLIFIVIIPYLLIYNQSMNILKFYMPMMVAFAHLLSRIGSTNIFNSLYQLNPIDFVPFISSNFINIFALFGILWQSIEYSRKYNLTSSIIYGILLFLIAFPASRIGLKFVLDNVDKYLNDKTKINYKYNWHLMVFGLLYIIFILGLQAVLLSILGLSGELKTLNNVISQTNNSFLNKVLKKYSLSNVSNFNKRIKK